MEKLNNIQVEIIEDGSKRILGYTVPCDEQGIADDLLFIGTFGGNSIDDCDNLLLPTSWTPKEIRESWLNHERDCDHAAIIYEYGVKMHLSFYEKQQKFYTTVQDSGFSEEVIGNYWA